MKWLIIVLALLAPVTALATDDAGDSGSRKHTIAVTSFANISNDRAADTLCTGIGETITVRLAKAPGLVIVERMRLSEVFKELKLADTALIEPGTAAKVGQMLGAQVVVVGAVQTSGRHVRVTARFVETETATVSTTAQADGELDDIFDLEDRVADSLLAALGAGTEEARAPSSSYYLVRKPVSGRVIETDNSSPLRVTIGQREGTARVLHAGPRSHGYPTYSAPRFVFRNWSLRLPSRPVARTVTSRRRL